MTRPIVLVIRDGYGINPHKKGNATKLAETPVSDSLIKNYPHSKLDPHGLAVGLPEGFQGSSEVGHLNIGAGRVVYQSLVRINKKIESGEFFKNKTLLKAIDYAKKNNSRIHLMGLVQDQGVHAHQDHLYALLKLCRDKNFKKVLIHFFSDGRDTPPRSAEKYLKELKQKIKEYSTGKIASIIGRYYAMDRDNRWKRTKLAYDAIASGKARTADSAEKAIKKAYENTENDEFIKPTIIKDYKGIKKNDVIIFFNYRYDRTRQLTKAFIEPDFDKFKTKDIRIKFVAMMPYYKDLPCDVVFVEQKIKNNLGTVLSKKGLKQLRISETEKYAHVTFFFNSQIEKPYKREDRILVSSPKVATYDLKPEMSVYKITEKLIPEIKKDKYDFILVNLVNGDMVGHTGVLEAAIKGVEAVDVCLGKIRDTVKEKKGILVITADHGNCEEMIDYETGKILTAHTTNLVDFILVSDELKNKKLKNGKLADIAPTILEIMNIKKPKEMTGESLIL
ncbi:2,3-bisphosphoglycerate-independent phosphoglycerate mutase [Candidatus Woesearchaeota archaeon]|nr:2,3-bisphosphoglycerate-independent phosphoglycerate mutase [Candidatus Woesearchaeota archaeon]